MRCVLWQNARLPGNLQHAKRLRGLKRVEPSPVPAGIAGLYVQRIEHTAIAQVYRVGAQSWLTNTPQLRPGHLASMGLLVGQVYAAIMVFKDCMR